MHMFDRNCCILYSFIYNPPEDGLIEAETCITVIKKYGECCCRVRSNGKGGIFNTESDASILSNSV